MSLPESPDDGRIDLPSFLSPGVQDAFWRRIDPDMRLLLDALEQREDWTYRYEEFPELFEQTYRLLIDVAYLPSETNASNIIGYLMPVLASMPFRECVASIAWLENQPKDEESFGWGMRIFLRAVEIAQSGEKHRQFAHAKTIRDRIIFMMKSDISTQIFA